MRLEGTIPLIHAERTSLFHAYGRGDASIERLREEGTRNVVRRENVSAPKRKGTLILGGKGLSLRAAYGYGNPF